MSVKIVYLEYEVHLSDPVPLTMPDGTPAQLATNVPLEVNVPIYTPGQIVKALQDALPGALVSSDRTVAGPVAVEHGLSMAPADAATFFANQSLYATLGTAVLPLIGPRDVKPTAPYIFSTWFLSTNNFPQNAASFVRKSGGWFGISFLFGTTTRYYWRGVFVYDAPKDAPGEPHKPVRPALGVRRWIDPGFANMGSAPGNPQIVAQFDFSRDAGRHVDTLGFAMRGKATIRTHTTTEHTTGAGATERRSWERLYIRLRKAGAGELFWRCRGSVSNAAGCALGITPSGQIALYNINNVSTFVLVGTTVALPVGVWKKLDLCFTFGGGAGEPSGVFELFMNAISVLRATMPANTGLAQSQFHSSSEIGTPTTDYTMELDIGFWMNSSIAASAAAYNQAGLDFRNGSRPVVVRPSAASTGANWAGNFRALSQFPWRDVGALTDGKWTSTTALAEIKVLTDTLGAIDTMPGSIGCVGFVVSHHGHKGTLDGQLGYKVGAAARVLGTFGVNGVPNEGGGDGTRSHASVLYTTDGIINTPITPFPALELHRIKGNDAVVAGTDHLAAVAEIIGTFNDEDYPPEIIAGLRMPLPYLGPHNAPYPRTPWARTSTPPISPVVIKSGTYVGNGTGQDLTFRSPVHWIWIRHTSAGSPTMGRWYSSMLGSSFGGFKTPMPWGIPDQLIDPGFVITPSGGAPTGVGALPDRSAAVATIVAANLSLLDGNENHKRDLLGVIIRQLNVDFPADGNNWGYLSKTDRTPAFTPADILMWKPTREHIDVLSDTAATWINYGTPTNAAWIWVSAPAEGSQEQQTFVRIASSDPEINQNAETYQYVAVADPGQRFMLNGAIVKADVNVGAANALIDTRFLPKWLWVIDTRPGNDVNIISAVRGPGHAASDASLLDVGGTQRNAALSMALGTITTGATLNFNTDVHLAYSAWRDDDGSNDPGVHRVVQIVSYVGNGLGSRDIALIPNSGRYPLWAMVAPHGATAYVKDSSHTGGNSTAIDGSNSATAITAGGIDFIRVGVTLNAAAVIYNVFVIPGGVAAGADGFSTNGEFIPVEPAIAPGSQWGEQPAEPAAAVVTTTDTGSGPGGGDDDMDTDLATACLPFTQRVCNIALSRIGVTKKIANLATDTTEEADVARLHFALELEATLRSYPWAFATKYDAALVLISGSESAPVNDDWTYSYTIPLDCVFVRRIVTDEQRAFDPDPPMFRVGQNAAGTLDVLFTNELTPTIEYTCRPSCSVGRGDSLFRSALAWRLAAAFAPGLTRIKDKDQDCLKQFELALERARVGDVREQQQDPDAVDADWIRGRD